MLSCLLAYGNSFANSDLDYKHYSNLIYNLLCAIPNLLTFMGKWRESEVPNNRLRDAYLLPIFLYICSEKPVHWWCKLPYNLNNSRVHISSNSLFSKILKRPFIVQKKMMPHIKGLDFSQRWGKKKIQNGRLRKFKMAASKKPCFPAPPILNIFSRNFYGLVLGLVELIDAKGIDFTQLIWPWGSPT